MIIAIVHPKQRGPNICGNQSYHMGSNGNMNRIDGLGNKRAGVGL